MQLTGKLIQHLPHQTGEGKNGQWEKSGFVIEIPNDKFPKKVCFTTWGDTVAIARTIAPGTNIQVTFDVESREYQGKWYSDIKAYKIEVNKTGAYTEPKGKATESKEPQTVFTPGAPDDLPF